MDPDVASIEGLLARGGAARIALLRYCVLSRTMEPLFLFLVGEYRLRPSHARAVAMFDLFCDRQAPARLKCPLLMSPASRGLHTAIATLRRQWAQMQSPEPPDPDTVVPVTVPARNLFDPVATALADPQGRVAELGRRYDPALDPVENLPGRRTTPAQRHFVERVWKPVVRPRLVDAGFWQLGTIE